MKSHYLKIWFCFVSALLAGFNITYGKSDHHVIDNPWINFSNGSILDITKVEMSDSCTVLTINAYYRPKWWIRIASGSYLQADGEKYPLKRTEGIEPDTEFWLPESGEAKFKLIFEPLPLTTEEFDFIEDKSPLAFRMTGVDLTGKKFNEYPEGFPEELKKDIKDGEMPYPKMDLGMTAVKFHFIPLPPNMPLKINMHVSTIIGSELKFNIKPDDNGKDSISFFLYGPGMASIELSTGGENVVQNMIIQPGENIDCYIDTRLTGSLAMSHRPGISRNSYNGMIHNGEYGNLDRLRAKNNKSYRLQLYRGYFGDYHMTGDEYMSMVKSIYDSCSDSINNSDTPQMLKELQLKELQTDVITAIEQYARLLRFNYQRVNNGWASVPDDSIKAVLTDEDYNKVTTWFDMSDPRLLMCGNNTGYINWNNYGVKGDLWTSVRMFRPIAHKAKKRQLEQTDIDSLKTLSDKFYATACDSLYRQSIREYQRQLQEQILTSTPEVPDDKLFDAIVEPHKGKVVVVDLWNTWCGPCRMALKNNEPLKQGELNNDDIVWIYIADDTSDDLELFNMIPDIKGIHYKVNEKQIKAISERFNVDGIPFYILIDREGNAERRPDLRNHSKYAEAIKSKL